MHPERQSATALTAEGRLPFCILRVPGQIRQGGEAGLGLLCEARLASLRRLCRSRETVASAAGLSDRDGAQAIQHSPESSRMTEASAWGVDIASARTCGRG